jgi:hypothetical protein
MNVPTVTVVIPNYNYARYLRQRIDSILGQTYQDFEIVYLDDASTDNSHDVLQSYLPNERLRVLVNERNSGCVFAQWNRGVGLARGKYIWIAEADDFAAPQFLERLVGCLDADPDVGLAWCDSWKVDEAGTTLGRTSEDERVLATCGTARWEADFVHDGFAELCAALYRTNTVPNASAAVFRRAVYDQCGGAPEDFMLSGDWICWMQIALASKLAYVGQPLNTYRTHGQTVRAAVARAGTFLLQEIRARRRILQQTQLPETVLEDTRNDFVRRWFGQRREVQWRNHWAIYREARHVDPRLLRRLAGHAWRQGWQRCRRLLGAGPAVR